MKYEEGSASNGAPERQRGQVPFRSTWPPCSSVPPMCTLVSKGSCSQRIDRLAHQLFPTLTGRCYLNVVLQTLAATEQIAELSRQQHDPR